MLTHAAYFYRRVKRYGVSDQAWVRIAPLRKGKPGNVGRSSSDKRLFINAVIYIARSGVACGSPPGRDSPEGVGVWN